MRRKGNNLAHPGRRGPATATTPLCKFVLGGAGGSGSHARLVGELSPVDTRNICQCHRKRTSVEIKFQVFHLLPLVLLITQRLESARACWTVDQGLDNSPRVMCCYANCAAEYDDKPGPGWHGQMWDCIEGCLHQHRGATNAACKSACAAKTKQRDPNRIAECDIHGALLVPQCKAGCDYYDQASYCGSLSASPCVAGHYNFWEYKYIRPQECRALRMNTMGERRWIRNSQPGRWCRQVTVFSSLG